MPSQTTIGVFCATSFAFLFWSLVNLGFLANAVAFTFFPYDVATTLSAFSDPFVAPPCWEARDCPDGSVGKHFELLIRAIGIVFLFATAGTTQCLVDVFPYNDNKIRRSFYTLTAIDYILASIGMIYLASQDIFSENEAMITVVTLSSLFMAAILLGLIGIWCDSFLSFKLPNVLPQRNPPPDPSVALSINSVKPPASRAAMSGV